MGPIERITGEMWPGVPVLPVMDLRSVDSAPPRRAGIPTFGVSGTFRAEIGKVHGADERLTVDAFDESVEFLYRLVKAPITGPAGP